MSKNIHHQSFFDNQDLILSAVDEVLGDWNGEGCLQFPTLLASVSVKLQWDDKTMRAKDAIIREYVRTHPDWYVTRGAGGGIMRSSEKQKKDQAAEAKKKAKDDVQAAVAAKVAAKQAAAVKAASNDAAPVSSNNDTDNINDSDGGF